MTGELTLYANWISCNHKSSTRQPTCTETAICTICAGTIPALGHDFGTPDYVWNGTECTAHRVCSHDASHEESETVTAVITVTQNRACTLDELSDYTAIFTNTAFATQTKQNVVTAERLEHDFTVVQHDETQHWSKCSRCDAADTKADHTGGMASCIGQAVCTVCHTEYGDTLGHDFTVAQHDATQHWNKCSRWDETDTKADHIGGTATCREQAVCEVCHGTYGERNGTNHVGGTEIRGAKSQNCTEDGYTGDTYCKGCGEKLSSGTVINADGHRGGMASCTDQAECEICHEKYGEPDPGRHPGLDKIDAIPATATSTGTLAHWRCAACGRLYADADGEREITAEDTIEKMLGPSITEGQNSKWSKGSEVGLTFRSDAAFSDFVEVFVDGVRLSPGSYAKREGSIVVELTADYLETLPEGEYTLVIRSVGGDAMTCFTVEDRATSLWSNAWVWIVVAVAILGIGTVVAVFMVRKRKAKAA